MQQTPRQTYSELFAAYLRGFETPAPHGIHEVRAGLQPTYEDLKPVLSVRFTGSTSGLQPTYEDLKHDRVPVGILPDHGLQPTYEDLKPFTIEDAQAAGVAGFAAYLRGFETPKEVEASPQG